MVIFFGKTSPLDSHLTKMCLNMTKCYHIFLGQGFKKIGSSKELQMDSRVLCPSKRKKNALLNYAYRNKNGSFSYQSSPYLY